MALLYNLAAMTVASTGTGTITLGAAATINGVLYLSFAAAGVANGDIVAYSINDVGGSEVGTGTYTSAGTTLTRTPVTSTNANAAINMTAAAIVKISPAVADLANLRQANTFTANNPLAVSVNSNGTLTAFSASNTDAGAAAAVNATFATTNAGSFTLGAASTAGGSYAILRWTGNGGLFIDDWVAGGTITFRTGATPSNALVADASQNVSVPGGSLLNTHATAGLGYGTGAGGTVTQATNRTTGVTINKSSGAITLFSQVNTAVSGATAQSFTVTNSAVAAADTISVCQKSGTDKYLVFVTNVAAGSFQITNYTTGGVTNEAPVFTFNVIKGVTS